MMWKQVKVSWRCDGGWDHRLIEIPGVLEADPLSPKLAQQAARSVMGLDIRGAWVIGNDGWGFAFYEKSYNKLVAGIDYDKE